MRYKGVILFIGIVFFFGEIVSRCHGRGNKWNRLLVSFMRPSVLPLTAEEAKNGGWIQDAFCDFDHPFYGNRYKRAGDISTRILFDSNGNLAGIQTTITDADSLVTLPTRPLPEAFVKDNNGNYLLTAYFTTKPGEICKKGVKKADSLLIQLGDVRLCKPQFMEIPNSEKELEKTDWVKGRCFKQMGVHYWYNISSEMNCDQFLPVFLLYDQASRQLNSFGWALAANIRSPLWEHPPAKYLQLFFVEVPRCLKALSVISTQHVYLTDPNKLQCTKP